MSARKQPRFRLRLKEIRKVQGMTQVELAAKVGVSQRTISHYEANEIQPPAFVLARLAEVLGVTADEILGIVSLHREPEQIHDSHERRFWKRFRLMQTLPEKDQRAVVRMIASLAKKSHNGS